MKIYKISFLGFKKTQGPERFKEILFFTLNVEPIVSEILRVLINFKNMLYKKTYLYVVS